MLTYCARAYAILEGKTSTVVFQPASPPLRPFVSGYWWLDVSTAAGDITKYLPGSSVAWIFGRGSRAQFTLGGTTADQPRAFVKGLIQSRCHVAMDGPTHNIGVAFQPGGATVFHDAPLGAFADVLADVHALSEPALSDLAERMEAVTSFRDGVHVLERFLLNKLSQQTHLPIGPRLAAAVHPCQTRSLASLADRSGYSERHLRRLFHREIGLAPKTFIRIVRVRSAASMLRQSQRSLPEIAHIHGYFDQAHLTHDFVALLGVPPTRFAAEDPGISSLFERWPESTRQEPTNSTQ